jgi:hypothetical protein
MLSSAIAQAVISGFPLQQHRLEPRPDHVGFVAEKVTLGQIFSAY